LTQNKFSCCIFVIPVIAQVISQSIEKSLFSRILYWLISLAIDLVLHLLNILWWRLIGLSRFQRHIWMMMFSHIYFLVIPLIFASDNLFLTFTEGNISTSFLWCFWHIMRFDGVILILQIGHFRLETLSLFCIVRLDLLFDLKLRQISIEIHQLVNIISCFRLSLGIMFRLLRILILGLWSLFIIFLLLNEILNLLLFHWWEIFLTNIINLMRT